MNNNNSPQETKEEILAKRILAFPTDGEMSDVGIKRNVYAAMDEYAKTTAVAFAEWMQRYALYDYNKHPYKFCNRQQPNGGRGKPQTWTAKELFEIFNNHHSIQEK